MRRRHAENELAGPESGAKRELQDQAMNDGCHGAISSACLPRIICRPALQIDYVARNSLPVEPDQFTGKR
jgi:hypothetical protein